MKFVVFSEALVGSGGLWELLQCLTLVGIRGQGQLLVSHHTLCMPRDYLCSPDRLSGFSLSHAEQGERGSSAQGWGMAAPPWPPGWPWARTGQGQLSSASSQSSSSQISQLGMPQTHPRLGLSTLELNKAGKRGGVESLLPL